MQQSKRRLLLKQRKQTVGHAWDAFVHEQVLPALDIVPNEIVSSWRRSVHYVSPWKQAVAVEVPAANTLWSASPLQQALAPMQAELAALAEEGALIVAVADEMGRILWTTSSDYMRERAEAVHFIPGSGWDERSAGTNAIGLALVHQHTQTVFAAEHYLRAMHEWVCYSTPIIHPQTGDTVGVFSAATTWDKHTPLGEMAVADMAHTIRHRLPAMPRKAELEIYVLGFPHVLWRGKDIHLAQRYLEILCLLALHPQGLSLAELHALLYGDASIALTSLRAELSHLRYILDGQIGSRPYRLLVPTWIDFISLCELLKEHKTEKAIHLYRGSLLPYSTSPALIEWRNYINAVMEQVVAKCQDPSLLLDSLSQGVQGRELIRERLTELMDWAKPNKD